MEDRVSRIIMKKGSGAATIPASQDHRNGDWISTDIYEGEWYRDEDTGDFYNRHGNQIVQFSQGLKEIKRTLTSAEILTINSVPIDTGIPLPTASQAIQVVSAAMRLNYGTVTFDGASGNLQLYADTSTVSQASNSSIVTAGADLFVQCSINTSGTTQLIANKKLMIKGNTDSTVGDSTIDVYVAYRVINL